MSGSGAPPPETEGTDLDGATVPDLPRESLDPAGQTEAGEPVAAADRASSASRPRLRVATALALRVDPESGGDAGAGAPAPAPLERIQEAWERVVTDLGGTPLTVGPTGLTALFGVPLAHGDDAARAARAALGLVERSAPRGRAAVDTARVVFRVVAGRPVASGDALDRVDRLADHVPPGEAWASPAAARHFVRRFRMADVVAGGERALRLEVAPGSAEFGAVAPPPAFVGRDAELDGRDLDDRLRGPDDARAPQPRRGSADLLLRCACLFGPDMRLSLGPGHGAPRQRER